MEKQFKTPYGPYYTARKAARLYGMPNFGPKAFQNRLRDIGLTNEDDLPNFHAVGNGYLKSEVRNGKQVLLIRESLIREIGLTFSLGYPTGYPKRKKLFKDGK